MCEFTLLACLFTLENNKIMPVCANTQMICVKSYFVVRLQHVPLKFYSKNSYFILNLRLLNEPKLLVELIFVNVK